MRFDPSAAKKRLEKFWSLKAEFGMERNAYRIFLGLMEEKSHRKEVLAELAFAGLIDVQDRVLYNRSYTTGHKAFRARATVEVGAALGWDTPASHNVIYAGALDIAVGPRWYSTYESACVIVKGMIDGVKIDCIAHKYAYLRQPYAESGIRLYSIEDIVAMKLSAIADDGSRLKDFVDIACLSTRIPFYEMLKCYERKFPQANVIRPFKALTYFDDIDFGEDIVMLNFEYDWKQIARRLKEMTVRQEHIFSQWPLKEQKRPVAEDKDMTSMKRGRKR